MRACALVDTCVKELLGTVEQLGGRWLLTSDHGNADDMVQRAKKTNAPLFDEAGAFLPLTSHTLVRVHLLPPSAPALPTQTGGLEQMVHADLEIPWTLCLRLRAITLSCLQRRPDRLRPAVAIRHGPTVRCVARLRYACAWHMPKGRHGSVFCVPCRRRCPSRSAARACQTRSGSGMACPMRAWPTSQAPTSTCWALLRLPTWSSRSSDCACIGETKRPGALSLYGVWQRIAADRTDAKSDEM